MSQIAPQLVALVPQQYHLVSQFIDDVGCAGELTSQVLHFRCEGFLSLLVAECKNA